MSPTLTPAFANGWRKLPNELKLEIFSNVLPHNQTFDIGILSDASRQSKSPTAEDPTDIQLLWLFLEHPEFRDLAIAVFVKTNEFRVKVFSKGRERPLRSLCAHVQYLCINTWASCSAWDWLASYAKYTNYYYKSLRRVKVVIDGLRHSMDPPKFQERAATTGPIVFEAETLKVGYWGWRQKLGSAFDIAELRELVASNLMARKAL